MLNLYVMKTVVSPQETPRAASFELWMSSPMPMVTLVKTLNVSRLLKVSKRTGMKFSMLMCWCIGKAASRIDEFYMLPTEDKMYRFDRLAVGPVVVNCKGGINYCDIPYDEDLEKFNADYLDICSRAAANCQNLCLDDQLMVIGTSAIVQTELDCIVNQYAKGFNNPMVMWGKYHKGLCKTTLPVSVQFHHVQMDGAHAARFLEGLQQTINSL